MKKGGDEMTPRVPIQASANPWSDGGIWDGLESALGLVGYFFNDWR